MHIDSSDKNRNIPELGEEKHCGNLACPFPFFTDGFGLAGGGFGPYLYCGECQQVVAKTLLPNDEA
jgi:hypothetical protein